MKAGSPGWLLSFCIINGPVDPLLFPWDASSLCPSHQDPLWLRGGPGLSSCTQTAVGSSMGLVNSGLSQAFSPVTLIMLSYSLKLQLRLPLTLRIKPKNLPSGFKNFSLGMSLPLATQSVVRGWATWQYLHHLRAH